MKIYCADPELRELLIEANKGKENFEFHDIDVPEQNNFNHVDYIAECSPFFERQYSSIFCFRYYRINDKEVSLEDIPELTDFYEILVYMVNQPRWISVCTRLIMCTIVNRQKKYMKWNGVDGDVSYNDPDLENYVYENYMFNESTYIIPKQLIPNVV